MECPIDGAQWVSSDLTIPCPRCGGEGKNISKMSIYKLLKKLPNTLPQYEVGSQIELTDKQLELIEDVPGTLELVEKQDENMGTVVPQGATATTPVTPAEGEPAPANEDLKTAEEASSTPSESASMDGSATASSGKKYQIYLKNLDLTLPVVSIDEEAGKAIIRIADVPEAVAKNAGLEGEFATYWYGENAGGNTLSEITE